MEKFECVSDLIELFIFFAYFDGIVTKGETGFNPRAGPPRSINHKRSFRRLESITASAFREKGRRLGALAREFVEHGVNPPQDSRPQLPHPQSALALMDEAIAAGFNG